MNTELKKSDMMTTDMRITAKQEVDIEHLLEKITALEAENKRLETWLGLISKGYSIAINQLSVNTRMP
jgi:cell shape-determining protein MreC